MSGPVPKPAALRQRRNKATTAALLVEAEPRIVPPLPKRRKKWHPMTVAWWEDLWRSPLASEYLSVDVHQLYILAELEDAFWRQPSINLAGEIRQHRTAFGLTPIDRRRLQWEVEKANGRDRKQAKPRRGMTDARGALRAV